MTLHALVRTALELLKEGAARSESPWRNPALVTAPAAHEQPPEVRTVVLRTIDPAVRRITIHTDSRSDKVAILPLHPACALHGWDAARRIQLRLSGRIAIAGEEETEAAWRSLGEGSRATYAVALAPGTSVDAPEAADARQTEGAARAVFTVLGFRFDRLEYLALEHGGHRRARFTWSAAGALTAEWLVP